MDQPKPEGIEVEWRARERERARGEGIDGVTDKGQLGLTKRIQKGERRRSE